MKINFDRLLRIASVIALVTIGAISLVPGDIRPHTLASGQYEHLIAYLLTALLFGLQVRGRRQMVQLAVALIAYAGILEIIQVWIPGRHAQFIDSAAGAIGVIVGLAVGVAVRPIFRLLSDRNIG